ncbi:MAG: DUF4373 domain-containing protein [Clostridium sp.]|nr:DUF4373 domain-containing protein [Clostridium sp.]MCM1459695.1 DUF4373 domain-containing protein [Bacteroides sp.]
MARHKSDGLRYFSFDTDFFYSDRRIKALRARFGSDGLIFYIYILTEIYRNGYYVTWNEDAEDNAIADLGISDGLIKQIKTFLVGRSLLTESILASPDTILTSPGIQKRYQEAVKSLKREVYVDAEIWLLNKEETASFIKVTRKNDKSEKKEDKSKINGDKSEKNHTKEIKLKETKRNKNILCKAEALALFERLWQMYPNKKGKGQVSDAQKMKLLEIGFDEMSRAIKRYMEDLEKDKSWRKPQNGSTFFNSGYIDYLDKNYQPYVGASGKGFIDFPQRNMDAELGELEQMFLDEINHGGDTRG